MKSNNVLVKAIVGASVAIVGLAGCGGGNSGGGGGGGGGTAPTITSFSGSPATIEAGSSTSLTGVFSGGTGVITPGNIAATSGTAVSVTPSATTMYTLTVTSSGGLISSQSSTVTVDPVPAITSFSPGAATIEAGSSTTLTAVFTGGTGTITPGNVAVTSGVAVTVSPTSTTPYTLTVTPPVGTINATMMATVNVNPVPVINTFSATPPTITTANGTSTLNATFTGGTGLITATGYSSAITSGVGLPVTPATTTTYTLTVTPPVGTVNATMTATVTVNIPPTISSFTVAPTEIEDGSSAQLTAVFAGGTGVVTPGNITMTSGTPVTVLPTSTTTYMLTVTPSAGNPITKTATLTVTPAPAITSFTATPPTISAGTSSTLTAVFSGGTGVITPGNITATSGTGVTVSPTTTTTYTLTVTPVLGNAITATTTVTLAGSSVTVNQTPTTVAVTNQILGMNLAAWYDIDTNGPAIVNAFKTAGIKAVRWPGGSWSDVYHWDGTNVGTNFNGTPFNCQNAPYGGGTPDSNDTFVNFVNDIVTPAGLDLALTADYGTNPTCNGGGVPSEAAYWIQAAESYGVKVSHMTVGNEEYGSLGWEENLNNPTSVNQAATQYATAMTGSTGFYQSIRAVGNSQNPPVLVGVDVDADNLSVSNSSAWDNIVLQEAAGSYDFVELHFYPESPSPSDGGQPPSDAFLTQQAAQALTTNINVVKQELATAGKPNTPIYVGEMGSTYSDPGEQSWSITQGLYAAQALGEMMNDGVSRATWWIGFGNCNGNAGYFSSSLYGWQTFGAYNVFSDGTTDYPADECDGNTIPIGTMSPTAVAFQLFSNVAVTGENVLTTTVAGDTTDVRSYAATHSGGTAVLLFNLNETSNETVTVNLSNETSSSDVTQIWYDKSIYDETDPTYNGGNPVWAGLSTTDVGAQTFPMNIALPPWSMTVLLIK